MSDTTDTTDTPTLPEVIRAQLDERMRDMHTCIPGVVVSYDKAKQRASVQPIVQGYKRNEAGKRVAEAWPVITNVPVLHYGSGDYGITVPVKAGDGVVLVFAEQSIDKLMVSSLGKPLDPKDPRRFNHNDAIAHTGFRSFKDPIANVPDDAMVLRVPSSKQLRLGDESANGDGHRVATKSTLSVITSALSSAAASIVALNPDGAAALVAFRDALTAAGFPSCATKTRAV